MLRPKTPDNEGERIAALRHYQVLDSLPEQEFDNIVLMAAEICEMPIALISLVDQDRQWFKAQLGLTTKETCRDISFCGHTIHEKQPLIVSDATQDERFLDNPLVIGKPKIRFYAGIPIFSAGGLPIGTLCVIDVKPGNLTPRKKKQLELLSNHITHLLEARLNKLLLESQIAKNEIIINDLKIAEFELFKFSSRLELAFKSGGIGICKACFEQASSIAGPAIMGVWTKSLDCKIIRKQL